MGGRGFLGQGTIGHQEQWEGPDVLPDHSHQQVEASHQLADHVQSPQGKGSAPGQDILIVMMVGHTTREDQCMV